jgi:arsenate reductase-like glutaredoxin family protein
MQMAKIILRIMELYEKVQIMPITMKNIHFWIRDQSYHAVFLRSDLTGEHVSKADKAWDYSLKFQELEERIKLKETGLTIEFGERMAKVSMYIISTCPMCRKTKEFFRARGIPFDFVDYNLASESDQNKIAAEIMRGTGHISFPFVRISDVVVIGFNPERFEQLLKSEKLEPATGQA